MDPVRKLNFGIVGGGVGGNIGKSHLRGALMDNQAVLVAGAFSRDQERNRASGDLWGVSQDRVYPDYGTMAAAESQRGDGIDFVIIVTPNHLHYPVAKVFLEHGIHVACEKPFTLTVSEAEELCAIAREKDLEIAITYTYAHYPMIRQARSLIRDGAIGEVMEIVAEYPEDWQMLAQNQKPDHFGNWFSDQAKAGESSVVGGMGIHAWYLLRAMTGLKEEKVIAQFGYYPKNARLESNARILLRYQGGAQGMLWTSSTAIGHDCTLSIKIFGEKGAIEWEHDDPTRLRVALVDQPVQIMTCERAYLYPEARAMSRLPAGHPEGFYEAFANIYREFCRHLLDKKAGQVAVEYYYPDMQTGLDGMKFIAACVISNREDNIWVRV